MTINKIGTGDLTITGIFADVLMAYCILLQEKDSHMEPILFQLIEIFMKPVLIKIHFILNVR